MWLRRPFCFWRSSERLAGPSLVIAGLMAVILAVSMLVMSRAGTKAEVRADELRADVQQRGEEVR